MKEASALAGAGFNVTVLGAAFLDKLKLRDEALAGISAYRFVPVVDLTGSELRTFSAARIGKLLHRVLRIENRWQLGEAYRSLRRAAFNSSADLYICHMEQAMAVGDALLRAGKRVAVDMEDWYSEDLPKQVRQRRPVRLLRELERHLLSKGVFGLCPSQAMAERLAAAYQCRPPTVIYNVFPWADRQQLATTSPDRSKPASVYWFSQTIGPGRGLEDLVLALPRINHSAQIHLRGTLSYGFKEWLTAKIPRHWADKIFFHEPVHNTELLASIAEHQIGFAGEPQDSFNKDLTISNKIFHYMLGGLAVVASNTKGQTEIAANSKGAIRLYKVGNPASLAEQLNVLLGSQAELQDAQKASLEAARTTYCWEKQEAKLVSLVEGSFGLSSNRSDSMMIG
jgi:glycosyltransferase involved in cell wall biosynthesis